ncbi:MAG: hypothetical protein QOD53_2099, partial [Thermoleophilaceae bacterium]|nr:hypothetical protein [Thermoleophilaceae bacterium]
STWLAAPIALTIVSVVGLLGYRLLGPRHPLRAPARAGAGATTASPVASR